MKKKHGERNSKKNNETHIVTKFQANLIKNEKFGGMSRTFFVVNQS